MLSSDARNVEFSIYEALIYFSSQGSVVNCIHHQMHDCSQITVPFTALQPPKGVGNAATRPVSTRN